MQKWRYCEVLVTYGAVFSGSSEAEVIWYRADGKHLHDKGDYRAIIARLGEEGWELVTGSARVDTGINKKDKVSYLFKKPTEG